MDKDLVTDFENLYRSYRKSKSGKKFNSSTARFSLSALDGVNTLKQQLESQTYRMSGYNEFEIFEPKRRVIKSCSFKDKVVQRCFCDYILHPKLRSIFITDNYAGQIGKGTLFGMNRLRGHMNDYYTKNGADGWVLKCDISKYFYSINHETLKDIVDYYFDDDSTKWLNHIYIDSTDGVGLPLGNQVAQIYALLMLHCIDQFATAECGIEYYGRYMDDFFLIHKDKKYLKQCLVGINELIESLGLRLNGKTQISPLRKGISFLGFHHYITSEGKYIRKMKGEKKRKIRKRLRNKAKLVKSGEITLDKFYESYNSWKSHAMHGNCIKLCHSMDLFVNKLLEQGE